MAIIPRENSVNNTRKLVLQGIIARIPKKIDRLVTGHKGKYGEIGKKNDLDFSIIKRLC